MILILEIAAGIVVGFIALANLDWILAFGVLVLAGAAALAVLAVVAFVAWSTWHGASPETQDAIETWGIVGAVIVASGAMIWSGIKRDIKAAAEKARTP